MRAWKRKERSGDESTKVTEGSDGRKRDIRVALLEN